MVELLEARILDGRERVRREVATILTPDLKKPNATATHEALLKLGPGREGHTRLVTTNFDRLFEHAIADLGLGFELRGKAVNVATYRLDQAPGKGHAYWAYSKTIPSLSRSSMYR